jgi:hypothetical protein
VGRRFLSSLLAIVASVGLLAPPAGTAPAVKVITYSVRGKGNVSGLEAFAAAATTTYADSRGWNLGGSLRFDRVDRGGDFTLWLAADALMPTFGGACDVAWSCRNGRNVVINEDRWLGATDSWNRAGAPLEAYRQMVLNHETGHWLGFGHAFCAGPGRAAPVMQQQSMSLNGCAPNPWPLVSEQASLAARRGVPLIQTGSVGGPPPAATGTTTTTARRPTTGAVSAIPLENRCLARTPDVALRPWRRCF